MHVGDRIKRAREGAGKSQGWLGEKVGASQTAISAWEGGRREPTREMVGKIADALGIPRHALEIDGAAAANARRPMVRLAGYVGAGAEAHFYAGADDPDEMVDAPDNATPQTVAAEIRGTSLGPAFDRWLVFYDDVHSPVSSDLHGQLCVVGLANDQVLVKIVRPAGEPHHFHLISNGSEEPIFDQEVLWAAKVTNMRPR